MFGLFKKDETKRLKKEYEAKLSEAMRAQRNGDIRSYSMLSQEADELHKRIQSLGE